MQVTFVLPGFSAAPIGGFAVVYEYANRLAELGHEITVVHSRGWLPGGGQLAGARSAVRAAIRSTLKPIPPTGRPSWFELSNRVRTIVVPRLSEEYVPDGDAVVATSWETAAPVAELDARKGLGFYLIQHYEDWAGPSGAVDATWRLPLRKIVISRWLFDLARELDPQGQVDYIPNGIDTKKYRVRTPIGDRSPYRVGMLYHTAAWKGTQDGIEALSLTRRRYPKLDPVLFGTVGSPRLPSWCRYVRSPTGESLVDLYNSFAIFLHPSWTEGFALPPAESMASGCALVAAANQGVLEYARDGVNALTAPIRDPVRLSERLSLLLANDAERCRLALAGVAAIRGLTWERATGQMERVLRDHR